MSSWAFRHASSDEGSSTSSCSQEHVQKSAERSVFLPAGTSLIAPRRGWAAMAVLLSSNLRFFDSMVAARAFASAASLARTAD